MTTLSTRARRLQTAVFQPLEKTKNDIIYHLTALELQRGPWANQVIFCFPLFNAFTLHPILGQSKSITFENGSVFLEPKSERCLCIENTRLQRKVICFVNFCCLRNSFRFSDSNIMLHITNIIYCRFSTNEWLRVVHCSTFSMLTECCCVGTPFLH